MLHKRAERRSPHKQTNKQTKNNKLMFGLFTKNWKYCLIQIAWIVSQRWPPRAWIHSTHRRGRIIWGLSLGDFVPLIQSACVRSRTVCEGFCRAWGRLYRMSQRFSMNLRLNWPFHDLDSSLVQKIYSNSSWVWSVWHYCALRWNMSSFASKRPHYRIKDFISIFQSSS